MENELYYYLEDSAAQTEKSSVEEPSRDTIDEVWGYDYEFYPDSPF